MTQETSRMAFHDLNVSGQKIRMQDRVFNVFSERPDRGYWSNREIAAHLGWDVCSVTPRTYELRQLGRLEYAGRKMCSVTGRWVKAWRLATTIRAR